MRSGQREIGDKLGPKLAAIVTESTIAARAKLSHHEAKVHQAATQAHIDRAGREVADLYRPIVHAAIDAHNGSMHPHLEAFLRTAASGTHQWQALSGLAMGSVSGALGSVVNNAIAPLTYQINELSPNLDLDQNTSAAAAAAGIVAYSDAQRTAAQQGYTGGAFQTLYELAQTPPQVAMLFELVNRGLVSERDAKYWFRRQGIPDVLHSQILDLRNTELSPADLALAILRGIITTQDGYKLAERVGTSKSQMDVLIANTGEPPSTTDLALGLRRGIIDKARFAHGVRQSRVRDEWISFLEDVQFAPISVADAVTANIQGHLSDTELKNVAHINGLMPQYVSVLQATAGEPISKTEVYEALRRGIISVPVAEQALRESRLKDKYIPTVIALKEQLPPAREVATLYSHGALTAPQAESILAQSGYSPEVQKAFIDSAVHGKVAALKNITLGQASKLYVEGIISWSEAEKLLAKTGYQPTELTYVKLILDDQRVFRNREAAINKIRTLYISYHIDKLTASGQIDALGVLANERDKLLALWDIQRTSNAKILTTAEITDAFEYNLIDATQAVGLLMQNGYPEAYAILVLEVKAKGPIPGLPPITLPGTQ